MYSSAYLQCSSKIVIYVNQLDITNVIFQQRVFRDVVDQTDDVDDAGHTSSESEVSYTDSGIPTTITPSPMDFDARISDHDDDDPDSPTKEKVCL